MGCGSSLPDTVQITKNDNKAGQRKTDTSVKIVHANLDEKVKTRETDKRDYEQVRGKESKNSSKEAAHTSEKIEGHGLSKRANWGVSELNKTYDYTKMDQHARKAPEKVKNSAEELVAFLSSVSKDHRMLARGFFVWSSENIRYDVDGFFGRSKKAPNDAESVMKNGRSVCEGYARVFELLCSKAGIPVKKISGFSKGFGYSPARPISLENETDHAWNAVQLEGDWYLIDSTWGAGHLDSHTNEFKKEFNDFYFLTDPKQFVSDHFPFMDDNLIESQKWQLLAKPLSLDEFNSNVNYKPEAFKIGVEALSHKKGYFEMKNEIQMTLKSVGIEDINFSTRLMFEEGNWLREQRNATFGYQENDIYKLLVHPKKPGTYHLDIFGKVMSAEGSMPHLMEYQFDCTEVKDSSHEYPGTYAAASVEKCILHEPMKGNLPEKTEILFRISAPYLQHVRLENTYLEKNGTMFVGEITTPEKGYKLTLYGKRGEKYGTSDGIYTFHTV